MDKEDIKWLIGLVMNIILAIWLSDKKPHKAKEPKKRKRRKRK